MLKYRINQKEIGKTQVNMKVGDIDFISFSDIVVYTDEQNKDEYYNGENVDKMLVICDCESLEGLEEGDKIRCDFNVTMDYSQVKPYIVMKNIDNDPENEEMRLVEDVRHLNVTKYYPIKKVNENEVSFSFITDKYNMLNVKEIKRFKFSGKTDEEDTEESEEQIKQEDNNEEIKEYEKEKTIISCEDYHYFDTTDDDIKIEMRYIDQDFFESRVILVCKYLDPFSLVIDFDKSKNININPDISVLSIFEQIFPENFIKNDIGGYSITADLSGITLYRENYLFGENSEYNFVFEKPTVTVKIPIGNTFETNLFQTDLINEHFVEAEKKKAIPKIIDIEKDVYHPCVCRYENDEESANDYVFVDDVYTIKFNLHFREHRGEDWLVENDAWWNGVNDFSIKKNVTQDDSSDLLSFLNFTNDDVHYQKNKLKKSFLRLSYYDSPNPANQNLLAYSTIFYNAGELFAKYIKHMETDGYSQIVSDAVGEYVVNENKEGIRVNREHNFDEECRLSSQFSVTDKNLSNNSSEGFYLYIWKDNESTIPQDLYMKVEFNHAGYGRTLPFFMPFIDHKKYGYKHGYIKSFETILNDFNATYNDKGELNQYEVTVKDNDGKDKKIDIKDGPYGMVQYMKYSYIHLKYYYDKDKQKHRYFIDPETYGDNAHGKDNNTITLNLYEAKIQ